CRRRLRHGQSLVGAATGAYWVVVRVTAVAELPGVRTRSRGREARGGVGGVTRHRAPGAGREHGRPRAGTPAVELPGDRARWAESARNRRLIGGRPAHGDRRGAGRRG